MLIKKLQRKKGTTESKVVFILYTLFLFTVTLLPLDVIGSEEKDWLSKISFKNQDKLVHLLLFFVFTFFLYFSKNVERFSTLFILSVSTGILIEILQILTAQGRTFDLLDIVADSIGSGLMVALLYGRKRMNIPPNFNQTP